MREWVSRPCQLEPRDDAPSGRWCRTHETFVSNEAIRCGVLVDIDLMRGLLNLANVTVEALKQAGFCTANPEGDVIHEMGKAHGIIHSALHKIGEVE